VGVLFHDFETRSPADLKKVGGHCYAADPSTEVHCCAYAVDDGPVLLWLPGDPVPAPFVEAANDPAWIISAFNAQFERLIARHVLTPRHGWPEIPLERYHCSQAAASALALPASLGDVASALGLEQQKDKAGQRLMLLMSRPNRAGIYNNDLANLDRLYAYCRQDVETERAIYHKIGHLSEAEQQTWLLDQRINDRGIAVDGKLIDAAIDLGHAAHKRVNVELERITYGAVTTSGQTERIREYLKTLGVEVETLGKGTLAPLLNDPAISGTARRLIELRLAGAHAASKKYERLRLKAGCDGRVRGEFKFHGASTGRWTSTGVQLQNFKKPKLDDPLAALTAVCAGDYDKFDDPLAVVGDLARAALVAAPGKRFIVADFSGIESRVLAWLAGEQSKIDAWANYDAGDDDPYLVLGRQLGFPEDTARATGKIADLAFGYGGGVGAYRAFNPDLATSDDEIKRLRQGWRQAHPATKRLWYKLEAEALNAVNDLGVTKRVNGKLSWCFDGTFLKLTLPSGRELSYPFAEARANERGNLVISYKDNGDKKGFVDCRDGRGTWFGTLIENAVSAVARDLLVAAMHRLDAAGYSVVLHIHDETVCEVDQVATGEEREASIAAFRDLMRIRPDWAQDLPIDCKARNGQRFLKLDAKTEPTPPPWENNTSASFSDPRVSDEDNQEKNYSHGEAPHGNFVEEYVYRLPDGSAYLRVRRLEEIKDGKKKKSLPQSFFHDGRWVSEKPKPWVNIPYRLPELLAAAPDVPVFVCEGEKDANSVSGLGFIATTNPEGADKWTTDLNCWFTGKQTVYILEDNDDAGRDHAAKVASALQGIVPTIHIVSFRELPEHGDITDWLAQGHSKEELLAHAQAAPEPRFSLPWLNMSSWDDGDAPPIEWTIPDRVPRGQVGLFSGIGGTGKTTVELMRDVAHVLGQPWYDMVPAQGPAIYVGTEDPDNVLRIRLTAVARHYGVSFEQLIKQGLLVLNLFGKDALIFYYNTRTQRVEPTPLFKQLYEAAGDIKPINISIDPLARIFSGNEIDRTQVYGLVGHAQALASVSGGSVTILSHPSLAGISSGSGLSGSTAWHDAFRFRQYLRKPKEETDDSADSDLRELSFMKIQYGPPAGAIVLRYQSGLFLPSEGKTDLEKAAAEAEIDELFLSLLGKFTVQGRCLVTKPNSSNYAPTVFAGATSGTTKKQFVAAMSRLFDAGKIRVEDYRDEHRNQRNRIIVVKGDKDAPC
jgi:DNA polymerase